MKKTIALVLFLFSIPSFAQKTDWELVQWACEVVSCSHEFTTTDYSPSQILGKPNDFLLRPDAQKNSFILGWNEKTDKEDKDAFVKVRFCSPQKINKIIIAENYTPGSITKVFLYDENDKEYQIYSGEPTTLSDLKRLWQIDFPLTTYTVSAVKIEAKPTINDSWNSIDAIGIGEIIGEVPVPKYSENIGFKVNTTLSEFSPKITADGKTLYFTREGDPLNIGAKDRNDDQDVWMSTLDEKGLFSHAVNIGRPINNERSITSFNITTDEQTAYFEGKYDRYGAYLGNGISYCTKTNKGTWSAPSDLKIKDCNFEIKTSDFFMSGNKKYLIFGVSSSSENPKDLYYSLLLDDGTYSKPKSLKILNTTKNDYHPFLASDNKTLYFSSDGRGGYGGCDMFVTKRLDDSWENWSTPINLGIEINSPNHDFNFSISAKADYAYLTTNSDTYGKSDIIRVKLKEEIKPNTVTVIKGKVFNKNTNLPISAEISYDLVLNTNTPDSKANSDPKTGIYKAVLLNGKKYKYTVTAKGYIISSEDLDLSALNNYQEIEKDIYLIPVEK